jgi:hypothetical protein
MENLMLSFYISKAYGLREQPNGTWTYQYRFAFPMVSWILPRGKMYRLSPELGSAINKILYKKIWLSSISGLLAIGGYIATRFAEIGKLGDYFQQYSLLPFLLALVFSFLITNCRLTRVAQFCKKVGTPC